MEEEYEEEATAAPSNPRELTRVTGFHKRKKKRRKEAQKKQEQAERRKRIEQRKKRKLEKEFALYGGALPSTGSEPDGVDENNEDEERDPTASVSVVEGTTKYDGENMLSL
ncbi:ribosomal RNA-processing protein 17-like [Hibiscus syriacus]|uniref:ribosomal RNA-processing protein 17-like n=1 Tax=Hibiscus syriacus TaxID=106335 RepID=UPI001923CD35|nr:ribosomal RNA-processing protein 17-like [Hibiscus syriacus]